jgi:hypothetical protein
MSEIANPKEKKAIIEGLESEVNDIHPILERIFPKLPRVEIVEYTHGKDEMGADFILGLRDDIIGDTEFVGIIVKKGKIAQDITDVERQIDECEEERLILNGKKKIRLDEVWVINNSNVTSGAKTKIHRKFSSKKIKFIDYSILCSWIDKYLPSYWYTIPPAVGSYLQSLAITLAEENKAHSLLPSSSNDFYVPQDLRKVEFTYGKKTKKGAKRKGAPKKETVSVFQSIESNKITFIEGSPGSGKSQMLRNAAEHYASPVIYLDKKLIPIFISYDDICKKYKSDIGELLKATFNDIGLDGDITDHQFILLIDAIDEHSDGCQVATDNLKPLLEEISQYPSCKSVLTTRPLDSKEIDEILSDHIPRLEIVPLNMRKVAQFIQNICTKARVSDRLLDDLRNSILFKQLPMTPIAAILLAHLVDEESKDLPSNLTELYMRYTELMLGRWDMRKGIESQKEFEAAKNIVMSFAEYSVKNKLGCVSDTETMQMFSQYLDARNLDIDAELLFDRVTSRSGILQRNELKGVVSFKHLSFAEFFYAMFKTNHTEPHFINERIYDPDWSNVYFFYIGLKKDCEDVLMQMLSIPVKDEDDAFFKMALFGDYLMAAYTTPYIVIERALTAILLETGQYLNDILSGSSTTKFSNVPPMRLLEFFKIIISNAYGYEYFRKAMDGASVEILSNKTISDDLKGYSLFFLATMYVALKEPNPFDGLIDELKDKLPLVVQFGILYESDRVGLYSTAVKKQSKKLFQAASRSQQFESYVKKIHAVPIERLVAPKK